MDRASEIQDRLVIQQPMLLPWIGFWHKLVSTDHFVLWAGEKFDKSSYMHRVKIGGLWVTWPVQSHSRSLPIKDVRLAEGFTGTNMAAMIMSRLRPKSCAYGWRLDPLFEQLYGMGQQLWLHEAALSLFLTMCGILKTSGKVVWADTADRSSMTREEKIEDTISTYCNGRDVTYLQGSGGRDYMGFDTLKTPVETRFQRMRPGFSADSILQLTANHPEPLQAIRDAGLWEAKGGMLYDYTGKSIARDEGLLA